MARVFANLVVTKDRRASARRKALLYWSLGGLLALPACRCSSPDDAVDPFQEKATKSPNPYIPPVRNVALPLIGFNYTDLAISNFTVDSQGGGAIGVSTPTSGGGGMVCCVTVDQNSRLPYSIDVKWTRDRKHWCEKKAQLSGPMPADPGYFAVHFYEDGHIEAEITETFPQVRLELERVSYDERKTSGNTVADEKTARCHDGVY